MKTAFSSSGETARPNYNQSYPSYCEIFTAKWKQLEVPRTLHQSIVFCQFSDWVFLDTGSVKGLPPHPQEWLARGYSARIPQFPSWGKNVNGSVIEGWSGSLYPPFPAVTWVLFLSSGVSASWSSYLLLCGDGLQSRLQFQICAYLESISFSLDSMVSQ